MKTCPKCNSKIVNYKGENLCLRCPSENKQVEINDEPTEIRYFENTQIIEYKFWKNKEGLYHREGGKPAFIEYYMNENIRVKWYWINGKCHRDNDAPAFISYFANDNIHAKDYYINGKRHRDNDKPAYIQYDKNGNIINEEYWVNGIKIK